MEVSPPTHLMDYSTNLLRRNFWTLPSALGGTPEPEILAYLGARELWEDTREEDRATFSFTPERADTGKFLRCSSQQTDHDGGLLFEGPQEITKEVTRKTAIQCLLSDANFIYSKSSEFIS